MGKGENARHQHFHVGHQHFFFIPLNASKRLLCQGPVLELCFYELKKPRRATTMIVFLNHSHTVTPFDAPGKQAF